MRHAVASEAGVCAEGRRRGSVRWVACAAAKRAKAPPPISMGSVTGPDLVSTRQLMRAAHATGQLLSSATPDWWTAALGALLCRAPETAASCAVLGNLGCRVPAAPAAAAFVSGVLFRQSCASGELQSVGEGSAQGRPSGCGRVAFWILPACPISWAPCHVRGPAHSV